MTLKQRDRLAAELNIITKEYNNLLLGAETGHLLEWRDLLLRGSSEEIRRASEEVKLKLEENRASLEKTIKQKIKALKKEKIKAQIDLEKSFADGKPFAEIAGGIYSVVWLHKLINIKKSQLDISFNPKKDKPDMREQLFAKYGGINLTFEQRERLYSENLKRENLYVPASLKNTTLFRARGYANEEAPFFEVAKTSQGETLYQAPEALLYQWDTIIDSIIIEGNQQKEIETLAVLLGTKTYPTLRAAYRAAQALET